MNESKLETRPDPVGMAGKITHAFIDSPLTPLIILSSILLGLAALVFLPREEEPQIKVPMIDVMVTMPGFTAKEVETRATRPMEELIWEIEGVEYVYSISRPGQSLVIVRFKVGEDVEKSLVKLNQKLESNFDRIPKGVSKPFIKPKSIDDVPILALTFHSPSRDHLELRRIVSEVENGLKAESDAAETHIIGGLSRTIRILLDPLKLSAYQISPTEIAQALDIENHEMNLGPLTFGGREITLETRGFFRNTQEIGELMMAVRNGKPVQLRDVAEIRDSTGDPTQYVLHGYGSNSGILEPNPFSPAVTLTFAKKPGSNAVALSNRILARLEAMKGQIIPEDVVVTISRNYGETASEKSNELLFHMAIAVVSVALLILFALGWRESLIVAVAIPSTLALTLLVFYLYGFTLNRITLFALIFSIGILVDDAIVVVENMVRHIRMAKNHGRPWSKIAFEAVNEVGNPTILATFAVIAAVVPMAFVGGLMGPYMRPIPIGAGAAMIFSLAIAFIATPWAGIRVLKWKKRQPGEMPPKTGESEDPLTRGYRLFMNPLIRKAQWRALFLVSITLMLGLACLLVAVGWVQVKMLPFDNKSEFQVIIDMPEGTPLETTAQATLDISRALAGEPEVENLQLYIGTASPFNFNGLVRHYYLRSGPHTADIQVNLKPKHERSAQSHAIASRIRKIISPIARQYSMDLAVAEVPPGPPVLQTLVAEVYGPNEDSRRKLAQKVRDIFIQTDGVVDVKWLSEAPQGRIQLKVNKTKLALSGISTPQITQSLRIINEGIPVGLLHDTEDNEDVVMMLEVSREDRATLDSLLDLRLPLSTRGTNPNLPDPQGIPIRELVEVHESVLDQTIYHKNLIPLEYVTGDVAGAIESPVYAILKMNREISGLNSRDYGGFGSPIRVLNAAMPVDTSSPILKWDGEWHITIEVFRDLGMAFGAVLILIYLLMVGWFKSYVTPLVVMAAIPFSLIGILPAHALMGAFFTATSMIGFMAGAGIVVRNSIILVDFIELRLREGAALADAVIDAGAVRFRPMLLTAMAVVVGAGVILFDPIFQGLALSLMAGEIASLFISRMAVPILYFMANRSASRC